MKPPINLPHLFSLLLFSLAFALTATAEEPESVIYAKIFLPMEAPDGGDHPEVEPWISRTLEAAGETTMRAVTNWVRLPEGGEDDVDIWDAKVDGKPLGCPVFGKAVDRSKPGELSVNLMHLGPDAGPKTTTLQEFADRPENPELHELTMSSSVGSRTFGVFPLQPSQPAFVVLLAAPPNPGPDEPPKEAAPSGEAEEADAVSELKRRAEWIEGFTFEKGSETELKSALAAAARRGDVEVIKRLVSEGADVNGPTTGGWPPLYYAIRAGHSDTVKALLAQGAKAAAMGPWGHTLLHIAAARGSEHPGTASGIVRLLLEAGADVNAASKSGVTPLHEAALSGSVKIAEMLIEKGANVNARVVGSGHCLDPDHDLAHSPAFGSSEMRTPLDFANALERTEVAALLRQQGGKTGGELVDEAKQAKAGAATGPDRETEAPAKSAEKRADHASGPFQSEVLVKAVSADGGRYAVYYRDGWDEVISIHEADTKKTLRKIVGHGDNVRALSFSPDGRLLGSSSLDKGFALWDVATGKLLMRLPGLNHTDRWAGDDGAYGFRRKGSLHGWRKATGSREDGGDNPVDATEEDER